MTLKNSFFFFFFFLNLEKKTLRSKHIHSPTARTEGLNKIEEDYVSPEICQAIFFFLNKKCNKTPSLFLVTKIFRDNL